MSGSIVLVVRRTIAAPPEVLFDAWTIAERLTSWWGPRPVTCAAATIDARVGGAYRIENRVPDGSIVVIEGTFTKVERPDVLAFTWSVGGAEHSHVTVRFERRGEATEVVILHEKIGSETIRDSHEAGWQGCLDGLARLPGN
jgi:glutathione S-transferase